SLPSWCQRKVYSNCLVTFVYVLFSTQTGMLPFDIKLSVCFINTLYWSLWNLELSLEPNPHIDTQVYGTFHKLVGFDPNYVVTSVPETEVLFYVDKPNYLHPAVYVRRLCLSSLVS